MMSYTEETLLLQSRAMVGLSRGGVRSIISYNYCCGLPIGVGGGGGATYAKFIGLGMTGGEGQVDQEATPECTRNSALTQVMCFPSFGKAF